MDRTLLFVTARAEGYLVYLLRRMRICRWWMC
jgi:hypothetical protein